MRLHYKGTYNLDPASLPRAPRRSRAVQFREARDTKALSLIANGLCVLVIILLAAPAFQRCQGTFNTGQMIAGCFLPMAFLLPHELLHAVCFREDVYLYTNLRQGMLFVIGTEDMSKSRFIFMSLLPNLVFGLTPYIIGMALPNLATAMFGAICTGMGAGDYYNIFNTLTQVPKGGRVYNHGFNSYWYLPK
ncbi:DUF3267 domain-containing protein [Acutalibacter sp. 1XD8-36]|uniref:DUF3267 domain-containing protein n=1 Tax=Acutalibacter sp. 1XD8-36 TaxID=2320852 RepID=UPI0026339D55|nr:DUF3267 domain-containing protein [Acutalibacter sp. 1XD8-36]